MSTTECDELRKLRHDYYSMHKGSNGSEQDDEGAARKHCTIWRAGKLSKCVCGALGTQGIRYCILHIPLI